MESAQTIQAVTTKVRLDDLIAALQAAALEKVRLSRFQVDEIFHLILHEIPYAYQVITPILAEVILDDSPHKNTSHSLNHVVVDIGNALFNPVQKDEVHELILTYLTSRKRLENEYAIEVLEHIFEESMLKPFPVSAHAALRQLALSMVENVINEKQLRKVPFYTPRPLTDIIRPVVYSKLHKLELDKIKFSQLDAFRHFISTITYDSYEKVLDQERLQRILQEKEEAYLTFKDAIRKKAPVGEELTRFYERVKFEQFDGNKKNAMLQELLDSFLKKGDLKTAMGYLSHHLRIRFTEYLHKLLLEKDITPATYQSNESIKDAHDMEFEKVAYDVKAIKTLMAYVLAIQTNFRKNPLHYFTGKKIFALIEDALVVSLLGNASPKIDPVTGRKIAARDGGYLKLSLADIYLMMYKRLSAIMSGVNGVFADKLRIQIQDAMANIKASAAQWEEGVEVETALEQPSVVEEPIVSEESSLTPPSSVTEEVPTQKEEVPLAPSEPETVAEPVSVEAVLTNEATVEVTPTPEPTPEEKEVKPLVIDEIPLEESKEVVIPTEVNTPTETESSIETAVSADEEMPTTVPTETEVEASIPTETVEPKPLEIDESLFQDEPIVLEENTPLEVPLQENVEPKPLVLDVSFDDEIPVVETPQETSETKPLLIDAHFDEEETAPVTEVPQESSGPKPLQIDVSFDDEIVLTPSATESVVPETAAVDARVQTGLDIMNNYQLGDMKIVVEKAWKNMLQMTSEASIDADGMDISSDCEVRLYVICDLIQQINGIDMSGLSESKKQILQDLKHKLMDALDNPLDENNWSFFEGVRRDNIDRTLSSF